MFVLRKITGKKLNGGIQMNFALGSSYIVVTKENNPIEFEEAVKSKIIIDDPIIYGYVKGTDNNAHQLSVQQESYIMTESGKTFDNLTLK